MLSLQISTAFQESSRLVLSVEKPDSALTVSHSHTQLSRAGCSLQGLSGSRGHLQRDSISPPYLPRSGQLSPCSWPVNGVTRPVPRGDAEVLGRGRERGCGCQRKIEGLGLKSHHPGTSAHRGGASGASLEARQLRKVASLLYLDSRDPIQTTRLVWQVHLPTEPSRRLYFILNKVPM